MHYLEEADLAKLFRATYAKAQESEVGRRYHLVALTCFFTGARISQVAGLKSEDLIFTNGRHTLMVAAKKRGAADMHAIHEDTDAAFDMSPLVDLAQSKPTFARLFGNLDRSNFRKWLQDRCAEAGIHSGYGHPHMFRHSAAMQIWKVTQRPGAIQKFLQHKSPVTALFYLAENDGKMAQAAMDAVQLT